MHNAILTQPFYLDTGQDYVTPCWRSQSSACGHCPQPPWPRPWGWPPPSPPRRSPWVDLESGSGQPPHQPAVDLQYDHIRNLNCLCRCQAYKSCISIANDKKRYSSLLCWYWRIFHKHDNWLKWNGYQGEPRGPWGRRGQRRRMRDNPGPASPPAPG